jgi:hypothetical protein
LQAAPVSMLTVTSGRFSPVLGHKSFVAPEIRYRDPLKKSQLVSKSLI